MDCPNCGRPTEELFRGICATCAAEKHPFLDVPEVLDVTECAHCGRIHIGASWRPIGDDRSARVIELVKGHATADAELTAPHFEFHPRWEDPKNAMVAVRLTGSLRGVAVEREAAARVRIKTGACPDCSREMGGYFESTLQVRGSPGTDLATLLPKIEDEVIRRMDEFRAEGRPNAFFTDVEKEKHGIDFILGSNEIGRILASELAERYGAETDETTKLFSRKDGRDVFRWTQLVRLPPYARGDFLLVERIPYKLITFDKRNVTLLDLNRHVRTRRESRRVQPIRVIGRSYDQQDAVIVSRSPSRVQLMDPVSYKVVEVPSDGIPPDAKTVPVFRFEETLYVVLDPGR